MGNRAKVDGELFPFGTHSARNQFYNFLSKTQSPCGPRRQQIIFRKSFQNTLKVLKSPPPLKKISLQSSLLNRTLCCKYGGWGFSTFAPRCERRFRRSQNGVGSHKIGLSWSLQSSTGRLRRRRPYAKSQAKSQIWQTPTRNLQRQRIAVKYRAPPAPATLCFQEGGGDSFQTTQNFFSRSLLIKG